MPTTDSRIRDKGMLKRLAAIALILICLTVQGCVSGTSGLKAYVDNLDGYTFLYPNGWIPVNVSGSADVVFRDLIEDTENVSVVVSDVAENIQLTDLGDPTEVGQRLLSKVIAPSGSERRAQLVAASERETADQIYYTLEYTVQLPIGDRHNLASAIVRRGKLFTLNISAPEPRWSQVEPLFEKVAASFDVY